MQVKIIDVDGSTQEVQVPEGKNVVQYANDVIGWIEPVGLEQGKIMLVDEEGLLKGLPVNNEASRLACRTIVGKVIICDREALL